RSKRSVARTPAFNNEVSRTLTNAAQVSQYRREYSGSLKLNIRRQSAEHLALNSRVLWVLHATPFACLVENLPRFSPREPQLRIGRPHTRLWEAEFPADYIGALDQCHAFVKRDPPR